VALSWPIRGAILPLTASAIGLVLGALNLYRDVRRIRSEGFDFITAERGVTSSDDDGTEVGGPPGPGSGSQESPGDATVPQAEATNDAAQEAEEFRLGLRYILTLLGFLGVIYVAGIRVAAPAFIGYFLWREAKVSKYAILAGVVGVSVLIIVLTQSLGLRMPSNLLGL
jgi:hypothetical protein